jgi:hypothetical protein
MNKIRHYLLIIFFLSLIACEDDNIIDDPILPDIQTFTFLTNDTYVSENQRKWVLIYDSENILLAEKELENNKEIILEWETGENDLPLMIQLITFNSTASSRSYTINAYTDLKLDVWHLNGSIQSDKPPKLGSNRVELNDFDYNAYTYRTIQNLGNGTRVPGDDFFIIDQHYNPDMIWMSFFNPGENPMYKLVENVSLNENFSFTSADFLLMENYVEYEFPESNVSDIMITSYQPFYDGIIPRFRMYYNTQFDPSTSIRGYYPGDLFTGYELSTYFQSDNITESMIYRGAALPAEFIRMETSEVISNTSIHGFNSLVSADAEYMRHDWNFVINVPGGIIRFFYYNVISPVSQNFNFVAPELPAYITDLDSEFIDLNNLDFKFTRFSKTDNLGGYDDFIHNQFVDPGEYDDYSLKLFKSIWYQD